MNFKIPNYGNKVNSWLNGTMFANIKCEQVYRSDSTGQRRPASYVVVLSMKLAGGMTIYRVASYEKVGRAIRNKDQIALGQIWFDSTKLQLTGASALTNNTAVPVQASELFHLAATTPKNANVPSNVKVDNASLGHAIGVIRRGLSDNPNAADGLALELMTSLVHISKVNPKVAAVVRQVASLV